MREIRCRRCGKMYSYEGMPPECCPLCAKERRAQYVMVRELVRQCPGITAVEVNQITEVPLEVILKFIDDGLLEVVPHGPPPDGELANRVGLMIKRAKENKQIYKKYVPEGEEIDDLAEKGKPKFTWHEG